MHVWKKCQKQTLILCPSVTAPFFVNCTHLEVVRRQTFCLSWKSKVAFILYKLLFYSALNRTGVLGEYTAKVSLRYRLAWPFCTKISYWSTSFSWMNYLVSRPDLVCRPKQTWWCPASEYLHSVSRPNRLYYCLFSWILLVIVRVVVLQRLGRWVRALAVMVTLQQLKFVEHSTLATHSSSIPLRHLRLALYYLKKIIIS